MIEAANAYLFLRALHDGKRWGLRGRRLPGFDAPAPRPPVALRPEPEPRREAALLVDRCLRALSRREASSRLALGRLALALRRRRGHQQLGFVRLGDFARERLGISGSECEALARVAEGLDSLPLLRAAFLGGEIGFTKVRLLVSIAAPPTEERWLERALASTTRELEAAVVAERHAQADANADAGVGDGAGEAALEAVARVREDDGREIDGEPVSSVSLRVPARVWLLFRRALELARRVAGEELPVWKAVEAIAADAVAAAPAGSPSIEEAVERSSSSRGEPGAGGGVAEPRAADAFAIVAPESRAVGISGALVRWLGLDWAEVKSILVAPASEADPRPDATDAVALDARMRAIERERHSIDARLGRLLALAFDRGLVRELGFATEEDYVRERLGISPRRARALVALARHLSRGTSVGAAYEAGRISWVQATILLSVVRAGGDSAAWVERASRVTLRRLADEVGSATERAALEEGTRPEPPPLHARLARIEIDALSESGARERQMRDDRVGVACDRRIEFRAPESVAALWRLALEVWRREGEPPWRAVERLLEHVTSGWLALPSHRDPVFARDGWRCTVPGCSSRRNLQDHHVVFRSRSGTNERTNRTTVCTAHHLHGIHAARIRVEGTAPDDLTWSLGLGGGSALARLRGDVYVEGAPWGGEA